MATATCLVCHPSLTPRVSFSAVLSGRSVHFGVFRPRVPGQRAQRSGRAAFVRAAVAAPPVRKCELPTWAAFEMGLEAVYWETANGGPAASGELLTLWFNPAAAALAPGPDFGIAFNGGFNTPIMCGGEPRRMTKKDRGPKCTSFFSIKINVPVHAKSLEFSFTNGTEWHGQYTLDFQVPEQWRNQPMEFFNQKLQAELEQDVACELAIFPDSVYIQDRCLLPGGMGTEEGQSCSLDIVPGCMDEGSPFYDPLATVDDGSCPIDVPEPKA